MSLPTYNSCKFEFPHCRAFAQQEWFSLNSASEKITKVISHLYYNHRVDIERYRQQPLESFIEKISRELKSGISYFVPNSFSLSTCQSCNLFTIWVDKILVYPRKTSLPLANKDMNADIKELYHEATIIFADSPRGATALLRLALEKLLGQIIGKNGKKIDDDIKKLVSDGLSPNIQKALDLLRVVGNESVHPGQIDLDDNKEVAEKLFQILNFIADEMITKPKDLASLYEEIMPDNTKERIKLRDSK